MRDRLRKLGASAFWLASDIALIGYGYWLSEARNRQLSAEKIGAAGRAFRESYRNALGLDQLRVWVVLEQYAQDDDGDWNVELEAVHRTPEGAQANLAPDYETTGYRPGSRERWAVEMDVLP